MYRLSELDVTFSAAALNSKDFYNLDEREVAIIMRVSKKGL